MPSITLSSLPLPLLSMSMLSISSLLSNSILLSSLLLLSNSSLLSVSTQPALLVYTFLPISTSPSDSSSVSLDSSSFLTYGTYSNLPEMLCLALLCLSRLHFEDNCSWQTSHLNSLSLWTFVLCLLRELLCLKDLPHVEQILAIAFL